MRMTAKAEYATRIMIELATKPPGQPVKSEELALAQDVPPRFIIDILAVLHAGGLVRSFRGRDGGYTLSRPAADVSIADVLRCVDGPLASVRDVGLGDLPYTGPTAKLADVWMALRTSMRLVLEQTSIADVASSKLPQHVTTMATDYRKAQRARHGSKYRN